MKAIIANANISNSQLKLFPRLKKPVVGLVVTGRFWFFSSPALKLMGVDVGVGLTKLVCTVGEGEGEENAFD